MTPRIFRTMLLASVALGLFGAVLDALVPQLLPDVLAKAQELQDESLSDSTVLFSAIAGIAVLLAGIASVIGLYLFRAWARPLALGTSVLSIGFLPLLGAIAQSGWAAAITELSASLWGAVLAAAYFSPLGERFSKR